MGGIEERELEIGDACPGRDLKKPRYEESLARDVLASHFDGELHGYLDPPDFVVCRDDEVVGWLEIVRATDSGVKRLMANLLNKTTGLAHATPLLAWDWLVTFDKATNARHLVMKQLVDVLTGLEEAMGSAVPQPGLGIQLEPTRVLAEGKHSGAGDMALAIPLERASGEGTVYTSPEGFMPVFDPGLINDLAERMAHIKEKSLGGRKGERHLFVWVEPHEPTRAGLTMSGGADVVLPSDAPTLPAWVSHIWMVSTHGRPRLWQYSETQENWTVSNLDYGDA